MTTPEPHGPPRPPGVPEEAGLLQELKGGNAVAFERVVRTHGAKMLAVARRMLRNEEDARDAVQESFLSLFRSVDRFEGNARLSTWLHRVVVNAALMKMRGRRRHPEESLEPLLPCFDDLGHPTEQEADWMEDPAARLDRQTLRERVRGCIDRLPETYRTVLLLRDIEEMDTGETAAALGVTENAVKIRLHRARQALRTLLDPDLREVES